MLITPIILEGEHVRLEPLSPEHKEGLVSVIQDGNLDQLFFTFVPNIAQLDDFITQAQLMQSRGEGLAFATIDKASNQVVGSTRYMRAELAHKRLELGFTFLAKSAQKTMLNTEAKFLMLRHAFEVLEINRVEFLADFFNQNSRRAILRLGAREEGILRSHMVMRDGRVRDTVVFSMVRSDWEGAKAHLLLKLGGRDFVGCQSKT